MSSRSMSLTKVFDNDVLFEEILVRVGSPTTLVCAAMVSRRWFRRISGPFFLRRFLESLPPRLFGFYVTGDGMQRPEFVLPPTPSAPEISTAAPFAANFSFDGFPPNSTTVLDCRHGRVLYEFGPAEDDRIPAVRAPLGNDLAVFLPPAFDGWPDQPEQEDGPFHAHSIHLPDDPDDDADSYRLDLIVTAGAAVSGEVAALRPGIWAVQCTVLRNFDTPPGQITGRTLLAGGKLYMVTTAGYILGLDVAAASFFVINPPEGVVSEYDGNLVLSRGDDGSTLYLVHVTEGVELKVWIRRMHGQGAGEWVLWDTVSLHETCGHFLEHDDAIDAEVVGVADNVEFVFMELSQASGVVVSMHLESQWVEKVYQRDLEENDMMIQVHPFYIVWNPIAFPALNADEGEEVHQQE